MDLTAIIRTAEVDDADAIGELHVQSWRTAYAGLMPQAVLDALDIGERQASHRQFIETPRFPENRSWVLEQEGDVVGWATTGRARDDDVSPETCELWAIYLRPGYVGQGLGRALMRHCLADCQERGYLEMVMWVLSGNERAQRFYAAAGFVPDPRREPDLFRDTGLLKMRMHRTL